MILLRFVKTKKKLRVLRLKVVQENIMQKKKKKKKFGSERKKKKTLRLIVSIESFEYAKRRREIEGWRG